MKRVRYIFAAGVVSAAMAMSIPVYADRSGKVELPQELELTFIRKPVVKVKN